MNKIKVLLIDDNQNLVDMVKQYFSSHAVIEVNDVAYNGKDGLNLLEKNQYDASRNWKTIWTQKSN